MLETLSKSAAYFEKVKKWAKDTQNNQIAIEATKATKAIGNIYDVFNSTYNALVRIEIGKGTTKEIKVVNLDKPKLTMIKGGKADGK